LKLNLFIAITRLKPPAGGCLEGERRKGADKTVYRPQGGWFFASTPSQGEGWDGG
jgi:hypothetical protein